MRWILAVWLGLVSGSVLVSESWAQEVPPMPVGTRLRVHSPPLGLFGDPATLITMDGRALTVELDDGTRVALARADILGLEVSRGRRKATAYGAVVGAALGLTLGAVSQGTPQPSLERETSWSAAPMVLGTMAGLMVGGAIGSMITYERWQPVYLNPYFQYGDRGRPGFGIRASLVF